MNRRLTTLTIAACLMIFGGLQPVFAETWDAYTDYNTTGTQTSTDVWQYFYTSGQGANGPYTPMTYSEIGAGGYNYQIWDHNSTYTAYMAKIVGLVPDIRSDFGEDATNSLAWRSPMDGLVDISITVRKQLGEGIPSDYAIYQDANVTPLAFGSVSNSTGVTHTFANVPVSVGSMFYLNTAPGASIVSDTLGLSFTVTSVPEPGTIVLLGGSLVGLLAFAWRKRK